MAESSGSAPGKYVFDNTGDRAQQRYRRLEALFDASTQRHIEARGISPGWTCLEAGGGSGSVARWMAERVQPDGSVLVTDINAQFLEQISGDNISTRVHDIGVDELEPNSFDLIHTRLVLVHVPQREAAIRRMATALKPGGWLVLEEFDVQSMPPNPVRFGEHYLKILQALRHALLRNGVDHEFGRRLQGVMRQSGLQNVEAEGRIILFNGNSDGAALERANCEEMKDQILATGLVTEREFEMDLERLTDPAVSWPSQIMWSAWGQRPG